MLAKRIIPCLDVTAGRVVKGINFVNLRDAGDPVELAQRYNEQGADEVVFLDITASSDERNTMVDVVFRTAQRVFIPLTVGGGIREVRDARRSSFQGPTKSVSILPPFTGLHSSPSSVKSLAPRLSCLPSTLAARGIPGRFLPKAAVSMNPSTSSNGLSAVNPWVLEKSCSPPWIATAFRMVSIALSPAP